MIEHKIQQLAIFAIPLLLSLSVHEWAHAWVANKRGDHTARLMGRLTLNPLAHIDMFGTVLFPALSIVLGGVFFGWAKPVPIDWRNFKNPKQDMLYTASAGPISNIILAALFTIVLSFIINFGYDIHPQNKIMYPIASMLFAGVNINLLLAFFNLIPLPPLDGSRILAGILPDKYGQKIDSLAPFGMIILYILLFSGVFSALAIPIYATKKILFAMFGLPAAAYF